MYSGNLNVEELMDWINDLNKYFDFEEIEDKKKVRYAATRLKGHAAIWWDELQIHRERRGKKKLTLGIRCCIILKIILCRRTIS